MIPCNGKRTYTLTVFVLSVLPAVLLGCAASVAQVRANPDQFGNQDITLAGTVGRVRTIPFVRVTLYMLDDGTGEIPVLSRDVPEEGQRLSIQCRLAYFSGSATVDSARAGQEAIIEFLVENELMKEKRARDISKRLMEFLRNTIGDRELAFFVIDRTGMQSD